MEASTQRESRVMNGNERVVGELDHVSLARPHVHAGAAEPRFEQLEGVSVPRSDWAEFRQAMNTLAHGHGRSPVSAANFAEIGAIEIPGPTPETAEQKIQSLESGTAQFLHIEIETLPQRSVRELWRSVVRLKNHVMHVFWRPPAPIEMNSHQLQRLSALCDHVSELARRIDSRIEDLEFGWPRRIRSGGYSRNALHTELERHIDSERKLFMVDQTAERLLRAWIGQSDSQLISTAITPKSCHGFVPTPIDYVLRLLRVLPHSERDCFVDVGCGPGRVALLAALLTPMRVHGIEYDPALWKAACKASEFINRRDVTFSCRDALEADIRAGTIFYLYTPFYGEILTKFMGRLLGESRTRPITVCTLGECTRAFDTESQKSDWIKRAPGGNGFDDIAIFYSL